MCGFRVEFRKRLGCVKISRSRIVWNCIKYFGVWFSYSLIFITIPSVIKFMIYGDKRMIRNRYQYIIDMLVHLLTSNRMMMCSNIIEYCGISILLSFITFGLFFIILSRIG